MTKDRASPMPVMTLAMSQFELLSEYNLLDLTTSW